MLKGELVGFAPSQQCTSVRTNAERVSVSRPAGGITFVTEGAQCRTKMTS